MTSQSSAYIDLVTFVHQECVKQRKAAVHEGVLVKIRETLDANFGPENVDVSNIEETKIITAVLRAANLDPTDVQAGPELESLKRIARANMVYPITIKFPELEISNSRRHKHRIYDLFVRFYVTAKGRLVRVRKYYLYGTRTTGRIQEVRAHYAHSHLPRLDWNRIALAAFCTGKGPINDCCKSLSQRFEERAFTLFCHSLKTFVRWESIEGKPFLKMADISSTIEAPSDGIPAFADVDQDAIWDIFLRRASFLPIDRMRSLLTVKMEPGKFSVSLSDAGTKFLIDQLENNDTFNRDDLFALQNSIGQLVPMQLRRTSIEIDQNKVVMTFRHKPIKVKIIGHEHNISTEHRYLNPKITDGFSKRLSSRFNIHFLRENALLPQCGSISA